MAWRWILAAAAVISTGCAKDDRLVVAPVSGRVTYKGQSVEGAQVVFLSKATSPAATGTTSADGSFRLSTYEEHDGAAPGEYSVTVVKIEGGPVGDPNEPFDPVADMEAAAKNPAPQPKARWLLPQKYATPAQSPLVFTVQASETNDFKIELTD